MTLDFAREMNLQVDLNEYETLMDEQKTRAKESNAFESLLPTSIQIEKDTNFTGYQELNSKSEISMIFKDGKQVSKVDEGEFAVLFNSTPFYAESGGQVGDTGQINSTNGTCEVFDTKKVGNQHIHLCNNFKGSFSVGDEAELTIKKDRRMNIVSNHSATHLMHSALRNVLGDHVEQKGSLVNEEKLRFDFSHPQALKQEEIKEIEPDDYDLSEVLIKTLQHPTVASKSFLITIGDRTVSGMVARDQFVGPYQVPVSDYSLSMRSYTSKKGEVVSIGEKPTIAVSNAGASMRMALAEALTNMAGVVIKGLNYVQVSAET